MNRPQVSVVGSGEAPQPVREQAYEVGRRLGDAGVTMVCGGGEGVMEAASRGVREADGGVAVGIRPEENDRGANESLDIVVPTGLGQARNVPVVLSGAAVIAIDGRYGTLTEIAYARKFGKPVFGIGTWDHERFDFPSDLTPEEAVDLALDEVNR